MKQGDHEHLAFEKFAEQINLDRSLHPLHLLYLNNDTQQFLAAFKAGYAAKGEEPASDPTTFEGDLVRVKTLLRLLWISQDAGGISMGRSYESVIVEAALELLEEIDSPAIEPGGGDHLNDIRSYLSSRRHNRITE